MDSNITQALLLSLVAFTSIVLDYPMGGTMMARPIVTGLLTGLVMGDIVQGAIIGATIELAFLGLFAVGAALPPDVVSGSILGTAFAISTGSGAEVALTLALPIATLVLLLKNLIHVFIMPFFVTKADNYADEGNYKGIYTVNALGGLVYNGLSVVLTVGIGFYLGSDLVSGVLNVIPDFVLIGLQVATRILPALGLALLAESILNRRTVVFFILGFALSGYLQIPITGLAVFGIVLALILTGYTTPKTFGSMNDSSDNYNEREINYDSEEF